MDDLDLMHIRADTLFTYDTRGRMLQSNEPVAGARHAAPRVFLGYTLNGCVVRFGAAVTEELVQEVSNLVASQPAVSDLSARPDVLVLVRRALERYGPITKEEAGPSYRFPEPIVHAGNVTAITRANAELARETYSWLVEEIDDWWPCFGVVREGAVVSVCFSSRRIEVAAEAGVGTVPAFRGRGYAAAVTAAWGAAIRASGRIPFYSTSWKNMASQRVAQHAGLVMFGADASLH